MAQRPMHDAGSASSSAFDCPFCSSQFTTDVSLRKHLIRVCYRHYKIPLWLETLEETYSGPRESRHRRAKEHCRRCRRKTKASRHLDLQSPVAAGSAHASSKRLVGRSSTPQRLASAEADSDMSTPPPCIYCNDQFDKLPRLRAHYVSTHDDQYRTKRWRQTMHGLYETNQADARLRTAIAKIEDRMQRNRERLRGRPLRDLTPDESSPESDASGSASAGQSIESASDGVSLSASDSEDEQLAQRNVALRQVSSIKHTVPTPRPVKQEHILQGPWAPLREHVPSPSPEPDEVEVPTPILPDVTQADAPKTFLDVVLSESILIWYAWFIACRAPRQIQVTAELLVMKPFEGVLQHVQESFARLARGETISIDELSEMSKLWKDDKKFEQAYMALMTAKLSKRPDPQGKLAHKGPMQRHLAYELEMWSPMLQEWIRDVQATWIELGEQVVAHAAAQTWRTQDSNRVYRWQADTASLFESSMVSQLTIMTCLTTHWTFWQPLFVDLINYTSTSITELEGKMGVFTERYAIDIAPLLVESMEDEEDHAEGLNNETQQ